MNNKGSYNIISTIAVVLALILLGWLLNDLYDYSNNRRAFDGLHVKNAEYSEVDRFTSDYDKFGDWVCVNVRGMSMDRAIETCHHEVGHEIFSEVCEKNMTKCLGVFGE